MFTAYPYLVIEHEEQYKATLNELETALETSTDTIYDPLNPLIDMLNHAIEKYEMKNPELALFIKKANNIPLDIAIIRTLMQSYNLTTSDLPEIGDKLLVSEILNKKATLTRSAISKLSDRFKLDQNLFYEKER
jgi:HTH-type transcriptional regulator/antitoxin HigA